jgi:hypothetical protein
MNDNDAMPPRAPDELLAAMAETFRERNAVYGDNFRNVGPALQALFPAGVLQSTASDHEAFHLLSLIVVKLSRFANAGLMHRDSIHDVAVYAAMLEAIIEEREAAATNEILSTAMTNDALHEANDGMARAVRNYSGEPADTALEVHRRALEAAEAAPCGTTTVSAFKIEHSDAPEDEDGVDRFYRLQRESLARERGPHAE